MINYPAVPPGVGSKPMIERIKRYFSTHLDPDKGAGGPPARLRLATAALLLEVTRADFAAEGVERRTVVALLRRRFQLDAAALDDLLELADAALRDSVSLYPFTRLINQHYTQEQKRELLECLWRVAFADGTLDKYEDHLIRTLADLIHLPHADFIRTKLRVQESR